MCLTTPLFKPYIIFGSLELPETTLSHLQISHKNNSLFSLIGKLSLLEKRSLFSSSVAKLKSANVMEHGMCPIMHLATFQ